MIKKVLISAIGGDLSQSVSSLIKKHYPDFKIYGVDISTYNASILFCDDFILSPAINETSYNDFITNVIEKNNIDIYIPLISNELNFVDIGQISNKCFVVYPGCKAFETSIDKFKTYKFLKDYKFNYPWTASDVKNIQSYPCIFKSKTGSGSKNIYIIDDQISANYFISKYENYIFQEILGPSTNEITCAVYRNKSGLVYSIQLLRKLNSGATSWAKVINDNSITKLCSDIANCLDVVGSINIQLINTDKGPYIFEINPRFSSTVVIRDYFGFQDVKWTIDEILNNEIFYKKKSTDKIAVRHSIFSFIDNKQ